MNDYEITVLVKGDLEEKKLASWLKSFEALLLKSSAKVKGKIASSKKTMAYEIKKAKEANYVYCEAEIAPNQISLIEPILKNDDSVIRYLFIVKK